MKKVLLSLAIGLLVSFNLFATSTIDTRILDKFHQQFAKASDVQWVIKNQFVEISFTVNGAPACAYYDFDARLVGTSRPIPFAQLPEKVKNNIFNKYSGYSFEEAIEFLTGNETKYYVTGHHDNKTIVVEALNGSVSLFKKL